jgi:parvulin-like peptidyl-prolyl isomerase
VKRAAVALALLLACGQHTDLSWAARVDGVAIPAVELRERLDRRLADSPQTGREDLLSKELNDLVNERVVLNRARELAVEVSAQEVEQRIVALHGSEFASGDPAYRAQVQRQMLIDRTAVMDLGPKLLISERDLLEAFEERREELRKPERAHIRQIVVADRARAEQLRQELRRGTDFAELARQNSIAPEADQGGMLNAYAEGELPEAFDRAFELRPGEISDVIESPYGFHIFLLMEKLAPQEPELEEVRDALSADLRRERLEELRGGWLRELRRDAEIQVNQPALELLR